MRACSDSIAQLASALAKAQIELVNPPKTLTGVMNGCGSGNAGRSYRYAPLSAGLETIRRALGKHELAVIQTTHLDSDRAMVLLLTTLAHGSGEFISAIWPVCHLSDMGNPRLMGTALTYARRYGLFTLVGIAGDDDLDAPESSKLGLAQQHGTEQDAPIGVRENSAAQPQSPAPEAISGLDLPSGPTRRKREAGRSRPVSLPKSPEELVRELDGLKTAEDLMRWGIDMLPVRSELPESSRALLDAAFLTRAEVLEKGQELLSGGSASEAPRPDSQAGAVA